MKLNRTAEIANWIRAKIESGVLQPGTKLEEIELANRFQVSKTPVREALIQLSSRGLVDLRQRRGATVATMTIEQLIAVFEVVIELECMTARLAAERMSPEMRKLLLETLQLSASHVDDEQAYDVLNKQIHEQIYRGSCNEYLASCIKDARARLRIYRRYPFQKPGRMRQSFHDHEIIISAIVKGDSRAASRAMKHHITTGGKVFADLVAQASKIERST